MKRRVPRPLARGWWLSTIACLGACGGAPTPPAGPPPAADLGELGAEGTAGFGAAGSAPSRGDPARGAGVAGRVDGRDVRLAAAFVLTPDVEGPVELHAFEADLAPEAVCPAGSRGDEPGVALRVVLPDTRRGDDPALVSWTSSGVAIAARAVRVEVAGGRPPAETMTASIEVRSERGDHLAGTMRVVPCPDDREAP